MSIRPPREGLEHISQPKLQKVNLFRRKFLAGAGLAGAAMILGGVGGLARRAAGGTTFPSTITDTDILNFALNLEYLEAEFYLRASTGTGLPDSAVTGTGTLGTVTGGAQVPFQIASVREYASAIAADEQNHVLDIRAALGADAVARPNINIQRAFTDAAVAAGIISSGQIFEPYANDENFLLSAFVFEDVGVTAYHGAATAITDPAVLNDAAGILAVEAYHAGVIRAVLYSLGQDDPGLITNANLISALRAGADGDASADGHDTPLTASNGDVNIVAEDPTTSIAYARTFREVLRIVYLGNAPGTGGGFFPNGMNGAIT
ncbi:MAG: ferritin-like domain-containing protein [Tepidisphaeraceae bacterium]|jgi:hypothetical protein